MKLLVTAAVLLLCMVAIPTQARELLQTNNTKAPAPAPSTKSPCKLPNGMVVVAPDQTASPQYYYSYYYSYSYTYYSYWYSSYYYYGRKLLQSQNATAPSPSSAPACCPTTTTKQGDTVGSILASAGQSNGDVSTFFFALNPDVKGDNSTSLPAGTVVTVPCYRILRYLADTAPPAPAPAPTASNVRASG